jgi:DNA-binding response OmpR family regulator
MNHSILVVDDDPGILAMTSLSLRAEGHKVRTASNGREGLEALRNDTPYLIILDLQMPLMDGRSFFKSIDAPGRPAVIILSAFGAEEACRELGAEDCISKPFDPAHLVAAVERVGAAHRQRLAPRESQLVSTLTHFLKPKAVSVETEGGTIGRLWLNVDGERIKLDRSRVASAAESIVELAESVESELHRREKARR